MTCLHDGQCQLPSLVGGLLVLASESALSDELGYDDAERAALRQDGDWAARGVKVELTAHDESDQDFPSALWALAEWEEVRPPTFMEVMAEVMAEAVLSIREEMSAAAKGFESIGVAAESAVLSMSNSVQSSMQQSQWALVRAPRSPAVLIVPSFHSPSGPRSGGRGSGK